jgi:ATP-dependent RNA helicase DOB1
MDSIKEHLIEVAYEWASGASFSQICKMTEAYEGSIIRTFRRLNELLKQMSKVSKEIGNEVNGG